MHVCPGIKRDGGRCTVVVSGPNDYCYQHDPRRAEERKRNAQRAGRARPSRDVVGIKAQLQTLADGVLSGEVARADAAVAGQLLNIKLRALETERRWRELGEIEARIEELERRAAARTEGRRGWQA